MNVGPSIKIIRERKGITRSEMAEYLDVSSSYLSLLENGKREINLTRLESISNLLKVPVSVILFFSTDKSKIESLDSEIAEKLSLLTLKLLSNNDA